MQTLFKFVGGLLTGGCAEEEGARDATSSSRVPDQLGNFHHLVEQLNANFKTENVTGTIAKH